VRPGAGREHGERAEGARGQAEGSEEEGEGGAGRSAGPQLLRHQPGGNHSGTLEGEFSLFSIEMV